jgi:hypothetical protein
MITPMTSLWSRARGLVLFGWLVALIRFGIDASAHPGRSDPLFWIGVYTLMPIAFLVAGIRGTYDDLSWKRLALMAILIGLLVWGVPNLITYTTARFLGWTEGRFAPPKGGYPFGDSTGARVLGGLMIGIITGLIGAAWCVLWTTLLIWLPGRSRRKRAGAPA